MGWLKSLYYMVSGLFYVVSQWVCRAVGRLREACTMLTERLKRTQSCSQTAFFLTVVPIVGSIVCGLFLGNGFLQATLALLTLAPLAIIGQLYVEWVQSERERSFGRCVQERFKFKSERPVGRDSEWGAGWSLLASISIVSATSQWLWMGAGGFVWYRQVAFGVMTMMIGWFGILLLSIGLSLAVEPLVLALHHGLIELRKKGQKLHEANDGRT